MRARAALRGAETPADQSLWARRLADAERAAAAALRPVAPANAALLERLSNAAQAYTALDRAAAADSSPGFDAARQRIRAAETELSRAVGDVAPGTVQARAAAPSPATHPNVSPALIALVVAVFGALGVGLGLATSGPRRRPRSAAPPTPAPVASAPITPPAPVFVATTSAAPAPTPPVFAATTPAAPAPVAKPVAPAWVATRAAAPVRRAPVPVSAAPAAPVHREPVPAAAPPAAPVRREPAPVAAPPVRREAAPFRREPTPTPAAPPAVPDTAWTCELTWSATLRSAAFRARATAPDEQSLDVARSRKLTWPPLVPPSPEANLVAAARSVVRALIDAGWTPTTKGSGWYAQRFAWAHDGAPPALGTIERRAR